MKNHVILQKILKRFDSHHKDALTLSNNDIYKWPKDTFKALRKQGIIKPGTPAKDLKCSNCEEYCMMPVTVRPPDTSGRVRAYISCNKREDIGRILVDPAALQRWQLDSRNFAKALASALGAELVAEEVKRDRMYFLGTVVFNQGKRSVLFVRDLEGAYSGTKSPSKALTYNNYLAPLILVPGAFEAPTNERHGTFISLRRILSVSNAGLALDHDGLSQLLLQKQENAPISILGETEFNPSNSSVSDDGDRNVFRLGSQKCVITFQRHTIYLSRTKGLVYISYLLEAPKKSVTAYKMILAERGNTESYPLGSAGAMIDDQALEEYEERLDELDRLIEEATKDNDIARVEKFQIEREFFYEELKKACGLMGRIRKASDDAERARKAVSGAIRRAMQIIDREHKLLSAHLKYAIKTGTTLSYEPEQDTPWIVSK
jgi:hypothetical protein